MDKMKISLNRDVIITKQDIEDIIVTALEGGIGYWCALDNTSKRYKDAPKSEPISITATKIIMEGGKIELITEDEGKNVCFNIVGLLHGLKMYLESGFADCLYGDGIDTANIDAVAADCIVQYAVFEEIVYG